MKYIQYLILVTIVSVMTIDETYSQKCKFDFDKKDPISDQRVRRNSFKLKKNYFVLSQYRNADEFKFELNMIFAGARTFTVNTEDQLILKLENGETITLYPSKEYKPTAQATGAGILTAYAISYGSSRESYEMLKENAITYVRSNMGGETYDVEIKGKAGDSMKISAQCMLQD